MNKAEIRPLLVGEVEKAVLEETLAYRAIRQREHYPELLWPELAKMEEAWRVTRLKRAQAELQLWLADRQWEAEELAEAQEKPLEEAPEEWLKRFP